MENEPQYLTQEKLTRILSTHYNVEVEVPIIGTKYKSDIQFNIDDKKYVVEFDGDSHYCNPDVMRRDRYKDDILFTLGFNIIRIPYWVQLNSETFEMFFKFKYPDNILQTYPHGFIDKKAKTPAHFCVDGIDKFNTMIFLMAEHNPSLVLEIIRSLSNHSKYKNMNDLIPIKYGFDKLKNLLDYLYINSSKTEKTIINTFLNLNKEIPRICSIENTIPS